MLLNSEIAELLNIVSRSFDVSSVSVKALTRFSPFERTLPWEKGEKYLHLLIIARKSSVKRYACIVSWKK
jgi:hypothetical protein